MQEIIFSLLNIVNQFGYIVIPISEMSIEAKRIFNVAHHSSGEIVIVSKQWYHRGSAVAKSLGYVLQKNSIEITSLSQDLYTIEVHVVKAIRRKESKYKNLFNVVGI